MKLLFLMFTLLCIGFIASANSAELTEPQKQALITAVKDRLLDPQSALFKFGELKDKSIYCGLVNSKNRMGGYVGDTPYIAMLLESGGAVVVGMGTGDYDSSDSIAVRQMCKDNGYGI